MITNIIPKKYSRNPARRKKKAQTIKTNLANKGDGFHSCFVGITWADIDHLFEGFLRPLQENINAGKDQVQSGLKTRLNTTITFTEMTLLLCDESDFNDKLDIRDDKQVFHWFDRSVFDAWTLTFIRTTMEVKLGLPCICRCPKITFQIKNTISTK